MLDTGVDGLKNYFNPMYYLKYDDWSWHFSGMNYPYGEHLVFTDGQPLLTYSLKGLQALGLNVADNIPAIFNLFMFASILLGIVFLYKIARFYELPESFALPVAVIIGCFSPQLHRLAGHYALSYVWVFPLFWFLTLKVFPVSGGARFKALPGLVLALFMASLLHVYYVMIGSLWLMAYTFVFCLGNRKDISIWRRSALIGLGAALIPLLLFKGYLWLTDPVVDRPSNPYGFFNHITYWEGVFLAQEGPVKSFLAQFADVRPVNGEGWAYVSFVGFLVLLFTFFRWGKYAGRRKFGRMRLTSLPKKFHRSFWAAILILFFSFGWPFNWGLEFLLEVLGPLKQFRSLGRFAWIFYYVFGLYIALYFHSIYQLMSRKGLRRLAGSLWFLVLVFWGGEMWIHMKLRKERIKQYEHKNILQDPRFDYREWLAELGKKPEDFQALLPVPTYFIGSEKFYAEFVDYYSTREGMSASYQTGLPLACGLLSRTSLSQTMDLLQVLNSPLLPKTLPELYPDDRPILLLGVGGVNLTNEERALLGKAELLSQKENIGLYQLNLSQINYTGDSIRAEFEARKDSLSQLTPLWFAEDSTWFHFEAFSSHTILGFSDMKSSYQAEGPVELFRGKFPHSGDWEVSVWLEVLGDVDGFPNLHIQEFDPSGKLIHTLDGVTRFQVDTYKNFTMSKRNVGVSDHRNEFVISLSGKRISYKSLLIRPVNTPIFHPFSDTSLLYNNYYLEKE